jgi:formyltetrahydrofolate hydrolase
MRSCLLTITCPERLALAPAVQWHVEHRVLPNGNRMVVFT